MAELGKAQTGTRASTPKITKINADDSMKLVYKNMGNNHAVPFLWADTVTMLSGTASIVIADGVKLHGRDLATYGNITATPTASGLGYLYVDKNTTTNVITIISSEQAPYSYTPGVVGVDIDIMYMMGAASDSRFIEDIFCRGNTAPAQALP